MFDSPPSAVVTNDVLPKFSAERTGQVPEGARVEIERRYASADTRATTTGVVLKASPEGLALANCTTAGKSATGVPIASKVPYVSRLFKNTGIAHEEMPVLWVPVDQISSVKVLAPKPDGFVAPNIEVAAAKVEKSKKETTKDEPGTLTIGIKTADAETEAPADEKQTPTTTKQDAAKSTQDIANVATQ
ncbi:MAG: hypothetical protein U0992_02705 [Planctomycetaceae bacterium]